MSETTIRIDTLLADLSAYLVAQYGISIRDAVGLVMQSPMAERMREKNSVLLDYSVEKLAELIVI